MTRNVEALTRLLRNSQPVKSLYQGLTAGKRNQLAYGISGSARALFVSVVLEDGHLALLVTANSEEAKRLHSDLEQLHPGQAAYFPAREIMPYEVYAHSNELQNQRLTVMKGLVEGKIKCVVAPASALSVSLAPAVAFSESLKEVKLHTQLDIKDLAAWLVNKGYERVERVENQGHFSVRGGIVDIYPVAGDPVRMEFFGDTVDSLRTFEITTQRSREELNQVLLSPAQELVLTPASRLRGAQAIKEEFDQVKKKLVATGKNQAMAKLNERVTAALGRLEDGSWTAGLERFHCYFYPRATTLLDYFSNTPVVIWNEVSRIEEEARRLEKERADTYAQLLIDGALLPAQSNNYLDLNSLLDLPCKGSIFMSLLPKGLPGQIKSEQVVNFEVRSAHSFLGKMDLLAQDLKRWSKKGQRVVLSTTDKERAQRLHVYLWDAGVEATMVEQLANPPAAGQIFINWPGLQQGFELPNEKLIVLTDNEVYGIKRKSQKSFKKGRKTNILHDLSVGNYVVHEHHGVGRYLGMQQLEVGGAHRDYLHLQYAGEDKLYLPTEQASLIQPYVGAEEHVPKLNKLGGNEWNRIKSKTKQSVEELAKELLSLYAARETAKGYAYPPDSQWQKEFEDQFTYEETPDQLTAIEEVKADMERPKPMDRLLVGDVGYGKTEVAMRAAFKACEAGKQVAMLVPTTVLAQQHVLNFSQRFQQFPMTIGVLSRFSSQREQKAVIEGLSKGEIDIVIGTHRMLSADVRYKDLGLLVIDEEQRFGVKHKERVKELRHQVDVLTLSATPIPRTLHMSLIGARDMSVIETAPEERYPVQTYVIELSDEMVRDAVYREIGRGGQVFYVYNRVRGLKKKAADIQQLVPEAAVCVAHGQMPERELEQVMLDFISGKHDVLVCTTIVENGLDIQNANTLIVDEADRMGLSQLYQLRGRVGRSSRVAYAYLTYKQDKVLNQTAEKRLSAIREFTELGAGFKIAMRDLEIRGAGNILGPEQHGHMLAVGFDLYCQMLEDAVKHLKGEVEESEEKPPLIELSVDAYIPTNYITDAGEKIEFYRSLTSVRDADAVAAVGNNALDRYGKLPQQMENLIALAKLRVLGLELGIESIKQVGVDRVELCFQKGVEIGGQKLMDLAQNFHRRLSISVAGGLTLQVRVSRLRQRDLLALLEKVLLETKHLVD